MKTESVHSDITVIGGGLAGVCAAIGAARNGSEVALIQNRPVLGGNSSSEVRVWVCGATAHGVQHFARETGVMGELFVENQFVNPEGNPYYWDLTVLEAVRAEPRITLYLNTDVREVAADGPDDARVINSVTGWQMGSEKLITFTSDQFIDCSGDGLIGLLAGAEYRTGREARSVYDESWAPEVPDNNTLGSTILFYSKDIGQPSKFVPPSFAKDIVAAGIPEHRVIRTDMNGCAFWWIEWGGEYDVVDDNEQVRDELQGVVYGIWDYIKNSGEFDADNLTLEWIGSVPGKREYRRFIGDHVLTQADVLGQTPFEDRVAFGGWSIDLHPPGGVYATERGSKHWHPDGNYHIPLRSLYSINVGNLWMAGRNISASHVAFGTTRVMATCAVIGEAAGIGASVAARDGFTPRQLGHEEFYRVRRAMLRADASTLGVRNDDPDDLALTARASASSVLRRVSVEEPADRYRLDAALGMVVPVGGRFGGIEVLLDADEDTELGCQLHDPLKPQNYLPLKLIEKTTVAVPAGEKQWVRFELDWTPEQPQNAFLVFAANPAISVHTAEQRVTGSILLGHREPAADEQYTEQFRSWKQVLHRQGLCHRLLEPTDVFEPEQVIGGYARPYGGPQLWSSESLALDPEPWIELGWDQPQSIAELVIIFDDDVEEDLINLHHHRTPFDALPSVVRDYRVEARVDGRWQSVASVEGNHRRHGRHRFADPIGTDRIRVVVSATNGADQAHVVAIRAYGQSR
ncbi:FAD-dependent oxidoreductase [Microlunatus soli]|uniref:FAD dependent oxidoreductase n=1 Tax=Microlunatus soli TaxID=630515 RepID=A0A1H1YDN7_9ACTN|nr:FAD-dependent oxidoreductase [Microlunatus soli]SDT19501.1 FAD dependent oxidoreductase [Microlunatus soli]